MKRILRRSALTFLAAPLGLAVAQIPDHISSAIPSPNPKDVILPNGKSQRDEILKAEREDNIKDAAKLVGLADQLKEALEREDRFVFSLSTMKKTEEIEKLAKRIRSRIHR